MTMKKKHSLFDHDPWADLLMGNHAVARAMIESKTAVITSFPGSPVPEIADALQSVDKEDRDYYFEYSANEKVALEVAAGASINGHTSAVFFKSVGLNVAADSMIQLPMMELIGGMVIILGDDPGANSSQNEQDNRWFSRMSYMPMLEPATPQEAYEMYHEAVDLSRKHRAPICLRLTTHVCHARTLVNTRGFKPGKIDWTPRFDAAAGPYVPITKTVFPLKKKALQKLEIFEKIGDTSPLNKLLNYGSVSRDTQRLGVISSGLPAMCLQENLQKVQSNVDLLKLGMTYPLPRTLLKQFMQSHDEVLIVEELDRVIETELKALAWEKKIECKIFARQGLDNLMGELDPSRTWSILSSTWPDLFSPESLAHQSEEVIPRLPQMCPGCGHRSAFHAIKKALEPNAITVADIGCHSLGYMPPYNMGEVLFSMGHGVSTASGFSIGNKTRKVVTFIGDATLIHAGMPGIANAAQYDHNITLVLMENGTTAMTGHQPRFGSGEVGDKLDLAQLLKSLGVKFIRDVDTYEQATLGKYIKEAMAHEGFAIVIAHHPCMLKLTRRQKKRNTGFKIPPVRVDAAACDKLHTCVADFGCPSFIRHEDGAVTVNEELCIGDGSCLQTCLVSAIKRKGDA